MVYPESSHRYRRISVGPEHTVRFRYLGQDVNGVPIANLSASGCFAVLTEDYAKWLREGTLLMNFVLEHEDLPNTPICAKIARVVPGLSEISERDVGIGIQFLSTSNHFTEWVDAYVSAYHPFQAPLQANLNPTAPSAAGPALLPGTHALTGR